ncbi:MAG: hypothetical protein ACR2MT_00005, partial [Aurantibacter sp.]
MKTLRFFGISICSLLFATQGFSNTDPSDSSKKEPRNVIFILTDDHRFDYMGFTGKVPWLETPNMDKLAAEGAYLPNTFV